MKKFEKTEEYKAAKRIKSSGTAEKYEKCFYCTKKLKEENILLVDDIYTTGSTIEEAAKELKKAGAQNIFFLTIAIGADS